MSPPAQNAFPPVPLMKATLGLSVPPSDHSFTF